ncbi:unnamed protein product [Clonostachys solani]|uniref:Rhodopsin domain-containing protein n=1 Tax=Clonostachys solani TaxID=160281 RepID=A0A9P0EKG2_9HYPO|nr:unnamed protein product [Clonostachys solani]
MADTDLPLVHPPMRTDVIGYLACNSILGFISLVILALRPLALCGVIFQGIHSTLGIGYDMPTHPELAANITHMLKIIFVQQIVYLFALGAIKLSILFFYLRIFGSAGRTRLLIIATMGLSAVWMVSFIFAASFLCKPVKKQWIPLTPGECGDQLAMDESMVITNIITDLVIIVLPMYTIWNLKLRVAERLGLMMAFSLGLAVVVAGIFRIVYIKGADLTNNLTGTLAISIFISQIEPLLGIICVSIPMLAPIYKRYRHPNSSARYYYEQQHPNSGGPSGRQVGASAGGSRNTRHWEMNNMKIETAAARNDDEAKSLDGAGSDKNLTTAAAPHGIRVETRYSVSRA